MSFFTTFLSLALAGQGTTAGDPISLKLNLARGYTAQEVMVNEKPVRFRAYEGISYVAKPVEPAYQKLNLYIPEEYFSGGKVGDFDAKTAPIFFPNSVGGYMPSLPKSISGQSPNGPFPPGSGPVVQGPGAGAPGGQGAPGGPGGPGNMGRNTMLQALARGYVVASPGARGVTLKTAEGVFTGKAPAVIVDLKAAVRFLRFNDDVLPGSAEKIISNGTSAGGAVSALLGASGNDPAYEPFLEAIGAAKAKDHVFAVSAYCPITNLEHADAAYEWQFYGVNELSGRNGTATLSPEQMAHSKTLQQSFPDYVNGLDLRSESGTKLTLNSDGSGTFQDEISKLLARSFLVAAQSGKVEVPSTWLDIKAQPPKVDFAGYTRSVTRMKAPGAFDALDLSTRENALFGTENLNARHFTAAAAKGSDPIAPVELVRLMNPMSFLLKSNANLPSHWRIRHGTRDRDTSLAISFILATKLMNLGKSVDFAYPWGVPHSGDYDLAELFAWMDSVAKKAK